MAFSLEGLRGREARTVERRIESLGESVILRVLSAGAWIALSRDVQQVESIDESDAEALDDATLRSQFMPAARLLSACLTDESGERRSVDEMLAVCLDEDGLDVVQIREICSAIGAAQVGEDAEGN